MVLPGRPGPGARGLVVRAALQMMLLSGGAAAWGGAAAGGAQRLAFAVGAPRAGALPAGMLGSFLPSPAGRAGPEGSPLLRGFPSALRGGSRRGGAAWELQASQQRENKRRRMLRIAELRREMAADVQRLRERVKQKIGRRTSTADREKVDRKKDDPGSSPHVKGSFSKQEVTKEMKEKTEKTSSKRKSTTINKVRDAQSVLGPLVKERRTSYERRRLMGGSGEVADPGLKRQRKQWGPKQMIYCPPEMRLTQDLSERQRRLSQARKLNQLVAGNYTKANGEDSRDEDSQDEVLTDTVFVCRHADRFNPDWHMRMETFAGDSRLPRAQMAKDFPLSELGHRQAADLGDFLASQGVTTVISSPYLRCLETAQHVAWATGAQILVEPGLAEGPGHEPGWLPDLIERYRYFPEIDTLYSPLTKEPSGESSDMLVIPRCAHVAKALSPRLQDLARAGGVAVITHASVAIGLTALLSLKGGLGDTEVGRAEPFTGFSDAGTFWSSDPGKALPVGESEFNRILERIDSARPGGAYKLTWSEEEDKWKGGLHCLTHYLEDTGRSGPRTPAWRFTFPTADNFPGENGGAGAV